MSNYIKNQVARINLETEYLPNIKITDSEGNSTNAISLSHDNVKELCEYLLSNFVSEKVENKNN